MQFPTSVLERSRSREGNLLLVRDDRVVVIVGQVVADRDAAVVFDEGQRDPRWIFIVERLLRQRESKLAGIAITLQSDIIDIVALFFLG